MARLERANAGVKVLCLTTWRHPKVEKTRRTGSYSRSPDQWGGIRGSNPRHPEPQSGALPTELIPPYTFQSFCFDAGAPGGTRTPGLLLRRQLLYPAELLAHVNSGNPAHQKVERVMGIEPTCSAWKADILPLNYTRGSLSDACLLYQFTERMSTYFFKFFKKVFSQHFQQDIKRAYGCAIL